MTLKERTPSVEELSALLDCLPGCIAQFDTELKPVFINAVYKDTIKNIIHSLFPKNKNIKEDDKNLWEAELRKVMKLQKTAEFVTYVKVQKMYRYISIQISPQFNNGELKGLLVIGRDLTDLKANEALLANAEDIGNSGNYEFDLVTHKHYFSDQLYKILGHEPNAFEPTLAILNAFIKQENALREVRSPKHMTNTPYTFETVQKIYRADGKKLHIANKGIITYDKSGKAIKISGTATDISTQVMSQKNKEQAEKEMVQNLYFIDTLAKATPGIISITDILSQMVIYMNRNVYELLGYTADEFAGINNQSHLLHPADMHILEAFKKNILKLKDSELIELEWRLKAKDGSWHWIHSHNKVFNRNDDGKPDQYISVSNFITDRKKAEEELSSLQIKQNTDLLKAIILTQEIERTRIAESLHNDLGQLLYMTRMTLSPDNKEAAEMLNKAIDKVRTISFDLMPAILKDFGLDIALKDIVKQLRKHGLKVIYTNSEALKRVNRDMEVTIYRVIQELANNVVKHSQASKVGLNLFYSKDELIIMLSDNGIGFDTDVVKQDKKGFGLGNIKNRLAIFNGSLVIISQLGKGTAVRIDLPFS